MAVVPGVPPKYVYKIIPHAPEDPFPEVFPLSDFDIEEGFIHLSVAVQIPMVADLFFNNVTQIWILKLEYSPLAEEIKWELGFPHLFGTFGAANVMSIEKFSREEDQKWEARMRDSTWLE